jgi:hypothetical protein
MSDGTLLDLVSRGKKDVYQLKDPVRNWFGSPYTTRSPSTREIRLLYPENPPRFGQWFDVVLPPDGDILTSFDLRITMPTWLPPNIAALNNDTALYNVTVDSRPYAVLAYDYVGTTADASGFKPYVHAPYATQYGWCDAVANNLITQWALFVDNVMVLKGYGEFNTSFPDMDTTQLQAPLLHMSTGRNSGSPDSIQRNATLPELVFRVPLPGCQTKGEKGLPICAFTNQKVYVRFWLQDKSRLVESYELEHDPSYNGNAIPLPLYENSPAPWNGQKIYVNGVYTADTLTEAQMGQPYIYARTSILNVGNELRKSLRAQQYEIRFRQQRRDYWTVSSQDFAAGVNYRRVIQLNGFFQSIFLYFRTVARTQQNKYTNIYPTNPANQVLTEWLSSLSLNVNGQDRIYPWAPKLVKTLANHTQLARDVNVGLYYFIFGSSPDNEPGGACNLARCQKAVINLSFQTIQPDPMSGSNTTYANLLGLSWNILDIRDGIAILRFPD